MKEDGFKALAIVSFLLLAFTSALVAQDQPLKPFVIAEVATIHSKALYPFLYTPDENDMTLVTGLVKYAFCGGSYYDHQLTIRRNKKCSNGSKRRRNR